MSRFTLKDYLEYAFKRPIEHPHLTDSAILGGISKFFGRLYLECLNQDFDPLAEISEEYITDGIASLLNNHKEEMMQVFSSYPDKSMVRMYKGLLENKSFRFTSTDPAVISIAFAFKKDKEQFIADAVTEEYKYRVESGLNCYRQSYPPRSHSLALINAGRLKMSHEKNIELQKEVEGIIATKSENDDMFTREYKKIIITSDDEDYATLNHKIMKNHISPENQKQARIEGLAKVFLSPNLHMREEYLAEMTKTDCHDAMILAYMNYLDDPKKDQTFDERMFKGMDDPSSKEPVYKEHVDGLTQKDIEECIRKHFEDLKPEPSDIDEYQEQMKNPDHDPDLENPMEVYKDSIRDYLRDIYLNKESENYGAALDPALFLGLLSKEEMDSVCHEAYINKLLGDDALKDISFDAIYTKEEKKEMESECFERVLDGIKTDNKFTSMTEDEKTKALLSYIQKCPEPDTKAVELLTHIVLADNNLKEHKFDLSVFTKLLPEEKLIEIAKIQCDAYFHAEGDLKNALGKYPRTAFITADALTTKIYPKYVKEALEGKGMPELPREIRNDVSRYQMTEIALGLLDGLEGDARENKAIDILRNIMVKPGAAMGLNVDVSKFRKYVSEDILHQIALESYYAYKENATPDAFRLSNIDYADDVYRNPANADPLLSEEERREADKEIFRDYLFNEKTTVHHLLDDFKSMNREDYREVLKEAYIAHLHYDYVLEADDKGNELDFVQVKREIGVAAAVSAEKEATLRYLISDVKTVKNIYGTDEIYPSDGNRHAFVTYMKEMDVTELSNGFERGMDSLFHITKNGNQKTNGDALDRENAYKAIRALKIMREIYDSKSFIRKAVFAFGETGHEHDLINHYRQMLIDKGMKADKLDAFLDGANDSEGIYDEARMKNYIDHNLPTKEERIALMREEEDKKVPLIEELYGGMKENLIITDEELENHYEAADLNGRQNVITTNKISLESDPDIFNLSDGNEKKNDDEFELEDEKLDERARKFVESENAMKK